MFTYGLYQRPEDPRFSPWPLHAFKEVENNTDGVKFTLLGGSNLYRAQAEQLQIVNFDSMPWTDDKEAVNIFMQGLDAYMHGCGFDPDKSEIDNLICAMEHGLPILSHGAPGPYRPGSNQHIKIIGLGGKVHGHPDGYVFEFLNLKMYPLYCKWRGEISRQIYMQNFAKHQDEDWMLEWLNG